MTSAHPPETEPILRARPTQILIIDPDQATGKSVVDAVLAEGWNAHAAHDGKEGLKKVGEVKPDVVLMDALLPDVNGLALLKDIRRAREQAAVLVISSKNALEDRVTALEEGADDYLPKPFSIGELIARVYAVLRRRDTGSGRDDSILQIGSLILDEDLQEVRRDEEIIELTPTEFELLRFLMQNPKRVVSKEQILNRVWHYDFGGHANIVELYISYLRRKIDADRPPMIHTVRGAGYVIKPIEE